MSRMIRYLKSVAANTPAGLEFEGDYHPEILGVHFVVSGRLSF